eukprot:jgi/Mesen1/10431/ME000082S09937
MGTKYWRAYFAKADVDIWTVIDQALTLAALDYPQELKCRRDNIAEKLFSSSSLATSCTKDEPTHSIPERPRETADAGHPHFAQDGVSRVSPTVTDGGFVEEGSGVAAAHEEGLGPHERDHQKELNDNATQANLEVDTCDEAELLVEIEMENQRLKDVRVLRQKVANPHISEEKLLDALHRLETFPITIEALKETGIGKEVNQLRKHACAEVRAISKRLVRFWKELADEWIKTAKAISRKGEEEAREGEEEDGEEACLPSPPMDADALLDTQAANHLEGANILEDFFDSDLSLESGSSQHAQADDAPRAADVADRRDKGGREQGAAEAGGRAPPVTMERSGGAEGKPRAAATPAAPTPAAAPRVVAKKEDDGFSLPRPKFVDPRQRTPESKSRQHPLPPVPPPQQQRQRQRTPEYVPSTSSQRQRTPELPSSRPPPQQQEADGSSHRASANAAPDSVDRDLSEAKRKLRENYGAIAAAKKARHIQVMEAPILPKKAHAAGAKPGSTRKNLVAKAKVNGMLRR